MTLSEAAAVLKARRGAMAELSRQLSVTTATISMVLSGKAKSARIEAAAVAMAEKEASNA